MTRILVIDDDDHIRQVLSWALLDEGYTVDQASDGIAALERILRHPPDIIVLDMKMPKMDGWEFARTYRDRFTRHAPIIVLTAAKDAGQRGVDVNADTFIAKPFDLDVVIDRVAAIANRLKSE